MYIHLTLCRLQRPNALHICKKRHMNTERDLEKRPMYMEKETCVDGKKRLRLSKKRPMYIKKKKPRYMEKETYIYMEKESCVYEERDV